jgi:hypothetical protein
MTPALPFKLPLPVPNKRDETDPAVLLSKLPVPMSLKTGKRGEPAAPNPITILPSAGLPLPTPHKRSHDEPKIHTALPEPMGPEPIIRPRNMMLPVTDPLVTVVGAAAGNSADNQKTGFKDTVINTPTALKMADNNPAPVFQTDSRKNPDGDSSDDFDLVGTSPSSNGQTLHDHSETHPNGEKTEDSEALSRVAHEYEESQRREIVPVVQHPSDKHTVSDQVIDTLAGETFHTHKETDKRDHRDKHSSNQVRPLPCPQQSPC